MRRSTPGLATIIPAALLLFSRGVPALAPLLSWNACLGQEAGKHPDMEWRWDQSLVLKGLNAECMKDVQWWNDRPEIGELEKTYGKLIELEEGKVHWTGMKKDDKDMMKNLEKVWKDGGLDKGKGWDRDQRKYDNKESWKHEPPQQEWKHEPPKKEPWRHEAPKEEARKHEPPIKEPWKQPSEEGSKHDVPKHEAPVKEPWKQPYQEESRKYPPKDEPRKHEPPEKDWRHEQPKEEWKQKDEGSLLGGYHRSWQA